MNNVEPKIFDLEERTYQFAKWIRSFIKKIPKTIANIEDSKQLIKSSGSVGANYIESVEALSKKDSLYRIKVCRKEAKESKYWTKLIDTGDSTELEEERAGIIQEAFELTKIFGSIVSKNLMSKIQD
jgi:four helix bundle protein